jgi:hypothetical protein
LLSEGSEWTTSATVCLPLASISCRVMTWTGAAVSSVVRLMFVPVISTRYRDYGWSCACAAGPYPAVAKAIAPIAAPMTDRRGLSARRPTLLLIALADCGMDPPSWDRLGSLAVP